MEVVGYLLIGFYLACLIYVTIYCLVQFHLLLKYRKSKSFEDDKLPWSLQNPDQSFPKVTVQLPIYNEKFVAKRLIENVVKLIYPQEKLDIQVIDDSTDETKEICANMVSYYRGKGFSIHHLTRSDRSGYKAGALKEAMKTAGGDYVAIFDADFLSRPDFLLKVLPYFSDQEVGVVQTRWEHLNEDYSLLTRLQAFQLNVHFTVEQKGRDAASYLLQFNGTAGVWRKKTIEDAGGWEADTLTEDLDLSYRAQLNGWKIVFRDDIAAPAELPAEMGGLKSQQYRWMKGGAETAKKILPTVWTSSLDAKRKFHATMHLLSSSVFLFVFLLGIFSVPILFFLMPLGVDTKIFGIFMISLISIMVVYFTANAAVANPKESKLKTWVKIILIFPVFLSLSMGLSLHNSVAVIQGFRGKKSSFVRTPKFNIINWSDSLQQRSAYLNRSISTLTLLEGILAVYFGGGLVVGYYLGDSTFYLFHLLLMLGYSTIFYYSIKHAKVKS